MNPSKLHSTQLSPSLPANQPSKANIEQPETLFSSKSSLKGGLDSGASTRGPTTPVSGLPQEADIPPVELETPSQRVMFTFKYLPKMITMEEVLLKIQKFGELERIEFKQEPENRASKRANKNSFKKAEFSFREKDTEQIFLQVRRIRIKGIQVKVMNNQQTEAAPRAPTPASSSETELDHSIRPTQKAYIRPNNQESLAYRFNRPVESKVVPQL